MVREPGVLFLHGGPGLNARMERRQYGTSLPVLWWDQPCLRSGVPRPFDMLVEAVEVQLQEMAARKGGPIAILANSFGARIAIELLNRDPANIAALTISGGVLDLWLAFVRFGRHLARKRSDPHLHRLADAVMEGPSLERLWPLIGSITSAADFVDEYWSPTATLLRATMRTLATDGRLLHWETFQAVVSAVVWVPWHPVRKSPGIPIRVLIGRCDPYMEPDDVSYWLELFPDAQVQLVNAGHFPHLELPPSVWMPG